MTTHTPEAPRSLLTVSGLEKCFRRTPGARSKNAFPNDAAAQLSIALPAILDVARAAAERARLREPESESKQLRKLRTLRDAEADFTALTVRLHALREQHSTVLKDSPERVRLVRAWSHLTGTIIGLRGRVRILAGKETSRKPGRKRDYLRHYGLYCLHFWWCSQSWPMSLARPTEPTQAASPIVRVSDLFVSQVNDSVELRGGATRRLRARTDELRWAKQSAQLAWQLYLRDAHMGVLPPSAGDYPLLFIETHPLRFESDCRSDERATRRSRRERDVASTKPEDQLGAPVAAPNRRFIPLKSSS